MMRGLVQPDDDAVYVVDGGRSPLLEALGAELFCGAGDFFPPGRLIAVSPQPFHLVGALHEGGDEDFVGDKAELLEVGSIELFAVYEAVHDCAGDLTWLDVGARYENFATDYERLF